MNRETLWCSYCGDHKNHRSGACPYYDLDRIIGGGRESKFTAQSMGLVSAYASKLKRPNKFKYGDVVEVVKHEPTTSGGHFDSGVAVVIGTDGWDRYSLMFKPGRGHSSWYPEEALTKIMSISYDATFNLQHIRNTLIQ